MLYRLDERFAGLRPDALASAAIVGAFAIAALVTGLVIATGQPVPILLTLGAIASVALLNALPLVVWIILVGVLMVSGPVTMFVPSLEKAGWAFSLLGFYLAGAAILYAAVGRTHFPRAAPAFVHIAVVFLAFGLVSLAYSGGLLTEGLRAIKRYFQFFGLFFVLAAVPFDSAHIKRWFAFLIALAVLQLPFSIYQRAILVPFREGLPGVYPLDIVVGTMEGRIYAAGSSSVMVLLLVFVLAFLVAAFRERILSAPRALLLAFLVAAPLAIGEVTLVVVLMPLALGAVYFDLIRRQTFRFIFGAVLALPIFALMAWGYLEINAEPGKPVWQMIEGVIAYNFGDIGYYGRHSLNRSSVYPYWLYNQSLADPVSLLFGHGLGSSFGGIGQPNPGHMDTAHSQMFIGLTAASSLLWDLGLAGLAVVLGMFLSAAYHAWRLTQLAMPGFDRALCRTLFGMALMMIAMLFYSTGPIEVLSQQVLTALSLGLIAWRWRNVPQHGRATDGFRGR